MMLRVSLLIAFKPTFSQQNQYKLVCTVLYLPEQFIVNTELNTFLQIKIIKVYTHNAHEYLVSHTCKCAHNPIFIVWKLF